MQLVRQAVGAAPVRYPALSNVLIFSGTRREPHNLKADIFKYL